MQSPEHKQREHGKENGCFIHDQSLVFIFLVYMSFEIEGPRYWPHALVIMVALGIVYYALVRRPTPVDGNAPLMGREAERARQRDALTYA